MNRRSLKVKDRIKNLGKAIKRLIYINSDKEKIGKYIIAAFVLTYRDYPIRLIDERKEVKKFFYKNSSIWK